MRQFDHNPYGAQDEAEERRREEAAYQEAIEEDQGRKAWMMYQNLPAEVEDILSPKMNALFGEMIENDSDALEGLNNFLYDLSLLKIKRREAA
ncbi:hypothetical protein [Xenorhabdus sp. Sc-CR9]|uniref:hypothetical protein n=1 Tax=Xenorhabdus sp. Sc-CR9 TaxID=2584468 RepID=UPI001F181A74|nr:hypothetical protein [Xenorhabdus sp. Sc-CR9]